MKKIVFAVAAASFLVSCGLPEGGNKGVVKKEEGVVRYDENAEAPTHVEKKDSVAVKPEGAVEVKKDSTSHK